MFGRQAMLAALLVPDAVVLPDTLWVALTLSVPLVGHTGSDLLEPADPVYSRVAYGVGSAYWTFDGSSALYNAREVLFPVPDEDWGFLRGWALCTEITGGQTIYVGDLVTPVTVTAGPDAVVVVGQNALKVSQV
jgi:hypothetical protein